MTDHELQIKANEVRMNNLFILTGKLVSNAATCDVILFSVFLIITECEKEIAQAIYYATESLPAKKNLVRKTLKVSKYKNPRNIQQSIKRITKPYLDSLLKDASVPFLDCLMAAQELSSATGKQCPIDL